VVKFLLLFGCGFATLCSLRLIDSRLPSEGAMNRAPYFVTFVLFVVNLFSSLAAALPR
jgi:hypothetical protein